MTALVVSIQTLGGPSFGDYHHQQQEQPHEDNDESEDEGSPTTSSSNAAAAASPLSSSSSPVKEWTKTTTTYNATTNEEEPPMMDGVPRSRYSLDDVEKEDDGFDESQEEPSASCVQLPQARAVPMTRTPSQDSSGGEYVMVEQHMDSEEDSLPSLNDTMEAVNVDDAVLLLGLAAQPQEDILPLQDDVETDPFAMDDEEAIAAAVMEDDAATAVVVPSAAVAPVSQVPFGGLENMGNTCYLNSALQMLASLDEFSLQIRKHIPGTEVDATTGAETSTATLRQALLNVVERLGQGETFSPDAFKAKVDERSPLFIGYRQQDAHEFLTTLLDLLDEDYKKKPQNEEDDEEMNDAASATGDEEQKPAGVPGDDQDDQAMDDAASPVKKQRLDEGNSQEVALPDLPVPSLSNSQSFKDLEFADIENLLHGNGSATTALSPSNVNSTSTNKDEGPRCKLIGGRMNTIGATLNRWDEEANDVAASTADTKTLTQEENDDDDAKAEAKPFSPVDDYFTTEVRVCLTCESCKYRRSHAETYLHLSLEIGPTIGSIEEGLRAFFKPEKRDIKCEKCFCETALQTTEITKLPRALLFHLKRFIVDVSPDYSSISYRKDSSPVSFEPHLELDEHSGVLSEVVATDEVVLPSNGNARYAIRSVVNHIGSSASCGHYTADACRLLLDMHDGGARREWIRFNDDYVSKITETEAVDNATSTAYMVMYELEPILE